MKTYFASGLPNSGHWRMSRVISPAATVISRRFRAGLVAAGFFVSPVFGDGLFACAAGCLSVVFPFPFGAVESAAAIVPQESAARTNNSFRREADRQRAGDNGVE